MKNQNQEINIQSAISDIAIIKQVLNKTEQDQVDSKLVGVTLNANLLLQSIALICVLLLCVTELASDGSMSKTLMVSGKSDAIKWYGIGFMGTILVGLMIPLYFVIWRAAKHNNEEVISYTIRNFKYLKFLSFFSDLLMKFIAIALVVLADRPDWVGPLLVACIGDYLLQQRFFTLPLKISAALGIACIAIAIALFVKGVSSLLIPLIIFALVLAISLSRLALKYKQQETADE